MRAVLEHLLSYHTAALLDGDHENGVEDKASSIEEEARCNGSSQNQLEDFGSGAELAQHEHDTVQEDDEKQGALVLKELQDKRTEHKQTTGNDGNKKQRAHVTEQMQEKRVMQEQYAVREQRALISEQYQGKQAKHEHDTTHGDDEICPFKVHKKSRCLLCTSAPVAHPWPFKGIVTPKILLSVI